MPHHRSILTGSARVFHVRAIQLLSASAATGLALLAAQPAMAAGTAAGTPITTSATIDYIVGSTAQTPIESSETVTVDRLIQAQKNVVMGALTVARGQKNVLYAYGIINKSNSPVTYVPTLIQGTGKSAAHTSMKLYTDGPTSKNGYYNPGQETLIATLDGANGAVTTLVGQDSFAVLQPEGNMSVYLVIDISEDPTIVNGDTLTSSVKMTVHEPNTAGNQITSAMTSTSGANTSGMDTVIGTTASPTQQVQYNVVMASLSIVRLSKVVSDLVNGTTNPKAIPGAVVEYCLQVSNAAGAAPATNVTVADTLSTALTYDSTYGIYQGGTVTSGACNADGTKVTTFASGKATGVISSLDAGATATVRYRATVN